MTSEPPRPSGRYHRAGARDTAQQTLDKAAGMPVEAEGMEVFSRAVQADIGIAVALILFGAAMGALFAVAYTLYLGRAGPSTGA